MVKPQRLDVSHVSMISTRNIGNGGQAAKTIFFRKKRARTDYDCKQFCYHAGWECFEWTRLGNFLH